MKIVVTEPLHIAEGVKQMLGSLGTVVYGPFDDMALANEIADCDAMMVRLGRHVGKPLIAKAPRLRYILTATTGLDHIDLEAARLASVRVISLRDCPGSIRDVSATAEHCFGLLLALMRGTPAAAAHVARRRLGPRPVLGHAAQRKAPGHRRLWPDRRHGRRCRCRLRHGRRCVRQRTRQDRSAGQACLFR